MALVNMAEQFQGLPMESLIGGPLTAAADAQILLARSTATFIQTVGFDPPTVDPNDSKKTNPGATRYVEFDFERPGRLIDDKGNPLIETVKLKVPLLSIVPVPNLQIDTVDITFDMEVKSSEASSEDKDVEVGLEAEAKIGYGPFSLDVKIHGQVKTHQENTRSSDNSARYHVAVHATNHGMPEGLARVFDMMASSVAPYSITPSPRSG